MTTVTMRPEDVDAAALVREVRAKEAWLCDVESFHIKASTVWTGSPEGRAAHIAELRKEYPKLTVIDEKRFPALRERSEDTIEIAWDRKRLFYFAHSDQVENTRIWDGTKGIGHTEYFSHKQEGYGLYKDLNFAQNSISDFMWPRASRPMLWWQPAEWKERREYTDQLYPPPEQFRCVRIEEVGGELCYVLCTRSRLERWSIGMRDHLLRRREIEALPGNPAQWDAMVSAAQIRGATIASFEQMARWIETLTQTQRKEIHDEIEFATNPTALASSDDWTLDWVELKPGCWFPRKQSYTHLNNAASHEGLPDAAAYARPWIEMRREIHIDQVQVDAKLPDSMFVMTFKDGVDVCDNSRDFLMIYKSKHDRTAEGWAQIVEKGERENAANQAVKKSQDALIGNAAPAFPLAGTWLNSEPLTWEKLKGKPVILDFFSAGCGPCRNDYPLAVYTHAQREQSGVAIIGIHTASSKRADIEELLKEYKMEYPVYVDVESPTWGKLYEAYHVDTIPHAMLVDQEGNVAGHGTLRDMAEKGRQLANAQAAGKT